MNSVCRDIYFSVLSTEITVQTNFYIDSILAILDIDWFVMSTFWYEIPLHVAFKIVLIIKTKYNKKFGTGCYILKSSD